jgi:hypothetical protein
MNLHPIETTATETSPDYEIIEDFDEMLEIDDVDDASSGATSEIAQWLREFRLN